MSESRFAGLSHQRVVEGYGARLAISAPDADSLARLVAGLPTGWELDRTGGDPGSTGWRITVSSHDTAGYVVREETLVDTDSSGAWPPVSASMSCEDLEHVAGFIQVRIRRHVGFHTRDRVFIHAGVVAHRGRAIVIPGHSFSGKSTLVAALVRAGAVYYSDEYAVLDEQARVNPYLEPLSLRNGDRGRPRPVSLESLAGTSGDGPAAIGMVAVTRYSPGSEWSPRRCSTGEGVVALMEHAVAARNVPGETLEIMRRGVSDALVLEGERGEADKTAAALLETADYG